MSDALEAIVIRRTLHVPRPEGEPGDATVMARQLDAALMTAGFKCSRSLLEHLSTLNAGTVMDTGVRVLAVVREMVGDHVRHNPYFKSFPFNVPDTLDFWAQCLGQALADPVTAGQVQVAVGGHPVSGADITGAINLRSLPSYGRYQHSYEEMLAAHDELIQAAGDRVTVLHLGDSLDAELRALYTVLAGARVPLSGDDLATLETLATWFAEASWPAGETHPAAIPVRENRAVINKARLGHGVPLLVDTVTDVLRLAVAMSGGDVGLRKPSRFRSFRRAERRALMEALQGVVAASPAKLGDVQPFAEQWKRLGERLHPHEHPLPRAQDVFAVARREKRAPSFAGRVEALLAAGDVGEAATLLAHAPGMLIRSLDRLLRAAGDGDARSRVLYTAEAAVKDTSGRVLSSLREHFQNRTRPPGVARVFINRNARAWVRPDTRPALGRLAVTNLLTVIDAEIQSRLPAVEHLVVDPAVLTAALPLSAKTLPEGFSVFPRGSLVDVGAEILRFFVYWRQKERRTDYDLSAISLDEAFMPTEHISWTGLRTSWAEYSGDITDPPPAGATEFIDVRLQEVPHKYLIPTVYVFAGEAFSEVDEVFFGFMTRRAAQKGLPFEPRTVRHKSHLAGRGQIYMPVVLVRGEDGKWRAKWLHLYLNGHPQFNQVEGARLSTSLLARGVMERDYLKVGYLAELLAGRAAHFTAGEPSAEALAEHGAVTYIGLEKPEWLPLGATAYTLGNLTDLIPG